VGVGLGRTGPAWLPWTRALRALVGRGGAPRDAPAELAAILPELGPAAPDGDAGRVRVFDAVDRLLARSARRTPVVVVLTTSTGLIRRPWTSSVS